MSLLNVQYANMVSEISKDPKDIVQHLVINPKQAHLWHMATGISGEAGELLDAIKKHVIYAKDADVANIIEELGDLEFYMEGVRQHFGITRDMTLQKNMQKLRYGKNARYATGTYSDEQAQTRSDKQSEVNETIGKRGIGAWFNADTCTFFTLALSMNQSDYALYWNPSKKMWSESASITGQQVCTSMKRCSLTLSGEPYNE